MIHKGHIVESEQSKNANGGTEMMRKRLMDNVDFDLLGDGLFTSQDHGTCQQMLTRISYTAMI